MTAIRYGLCKGGPRSGKTLATQQPGVVHYPDDQTGYYVFRQAVGPTPAQWLWIASKEKSNADK